MRTSAIIPLLAALPSALAHFTMTTPSSIGFSDGDESIWPCGGYPIRSRQSPTLWPLGGRPIGITTTHSETHLEIRTGLLNGTDPSSELQYLINPVHQRGIGLFCLPMVPGVPEWVGLDAVVQVAQYASDGWLYQCLAVKFVAGPATQPSPETCRNSTGDAMFMPTGDGSTPIGHFVAPSSSGGNIGTSSDVEPTDVESDADWIQPRGLGGFSELLYFSVVLPVVYEVLFALWVQ